MVTEWMSSTDARLPSPNWYATATDPAFPTHGGFVLAAPSIMESSAIRTRKRTDGRDDVANEADFSGMTTLLAGGARKRTFADGLGGKEQRFADVLGFEVRVQPKDLLRRLPLGDQPNDCRNRNSKSAQAGNPSHLVRADGDALELHDHIIVAAGRAVSSSELGNVAMARPNQRARSGTADDLSAFSGKLDHP